MIHKKNIQNLLKKDMTRKEFLQALGVATLGIIGLSSFLKNIDKFAANQTGSTKRQGYGSSPYGR